MSEMRCQWCDEECIALFDIRTDGGEHLEVCEECKQMFEDKMFD